MASSLTSERQGMGASFTLHRSDVHAQSEADGNETKLRQHIRRNRRGQLIRRGRVQFKELGAPIDRDDIVKMSGVKISKVLRVTQNIGTSHHDARSKKTDGERVNEYAAPSDAKDGELGLSDEKQEEDLDTDEAQQTHVQLPHGLFGKDLPRCAGRDKATDGFRMLREFVRESEGRVQQVKSMVPGTVYGLDYSVSMLNFLMPPRSNYPPAADKRTLSARGSISASTKENLERQPASARAVMQTTRQSQTMSDGVGQLEIRPPDGPKPRRPPLMALQDQREAERRARRCPGRPTNPQSFNRQVYVSPMQSEMRPRPLPIRLPSLANFIAKSEPAMGGRSERGENSHIREMINELLGLDREKVLKLPQESEQAGVRRGRTDFKRKLDKQLDVTWTTENRGLLKRFQGGAAEEGKTEPERAVGNVDAPGATGAEEATAGGEVDRRRKREWTEAEEAEAYAKFVALLRESDPTISPVARLRATLCAYQEARDRHKGHLQSALYSMDADRLNSLKRRAQHLQPKSEGPTADAKTSCALMRLEAERDMLQQHTQDRMKKQYLWYRDLWACVRGDKRDLPKVAHFIFDFVKNVLEYGEEFRKEMYFAMLEHIDNYEFSAVIASLTVNMIQGIEGITCRDVVDWFLENRGEVPMCIADLTGKEKDHSTKTNGAELGEAADLGDTHTGSKTKQSLTFVTEVA